MDSNKKLYLYSGLAIALSVVAYVVITRKKKLDTDPSSNDKSVEETITTPIGTVISIEQAINDPKLQEIIKLPLSQAKARLLGKSIFTKVPNVNPRQSASVNNGWFVNNSVGGRIIEKDTLIGSVIDVVNDNGSIKNVNGDIYKWFKVNPSPEAIKQIKDDSNILLGSVTSKPFFVREDVVKLL